MTKKEKLKNIFKKIGVIALLVLSLWSFLSIITNCKKINTLSVKADTYIDYDLNYEINDIYYDIYSGTHINRKVNISNVSLKIVNYDDYYSLNGISFDYSSGINTNYSFNYEFTKNINIIFSNYNMPNIVLNTPLNYSYLNMSFTFGNQSSTYYSNIYKQPNVLISSFNYRLGSYENIYNFNYNVDGVPLYSVPSVAGNLNKNYNNVTYSDFGFVINLNIENLITNFNNSINSNYNDGYKNGYNLGVSRGINQVVDNPNDYNLYSNDDYITYGNNKFNDGIEQVTNNPGNYDLYTYDDYLQYGLDEFESGRNSVTPDLPTTGFKTLLASILNAPYNFLHGVLNFDFMGVNLWGLFSFFITTFIIFGIVRKVILK